MLVGLAGSSDCPYCDAGVPETLTHFACVCPQFREALTSAHNQVRKVISSFLIRWISPKWIVHEETRDRSLFFWKPNFVLRKSEKNRFFFRKFRIFSDFLKLFRIFRIFLRILQISENWDFSAPMSAWLRSGTCKHGSGIIFWVEHGRRTLTDGFYNWISNFFGWNIASGRSLKPFINA